MLEIKRTVTLIHQISTLIILVCRKLTTKDNAFDSLPGQLFKYSDCNIKHGFYLIYLNMHGTFSSNACKKYFWPHEIILKLMLDTNYAYSKTNKLVNR